MKNVRVNSRSGETYPYVNYTPSKSAQKIYTIKFDENIYQIFLQIHVRKHASNLYGWIDNANADFWHLDVLVLII